MLFNVVVRPEMGRALGIYRIAHCLREQNFDVEVIDWATFWTIDELKQLFLSRDPDKIKLVGFSHLFSFWTDTMQEFVTWIKQNYPHIHTLSGSHTAPLFKATGIDYYIEGYGEVALVELLKYMLSNGPRPRFNLKRINGGYLISANSNYPAYPLKSLMVKYEDRDFVKSHEWLMMETARGCRFACSFCNYPILGVKEDHTRTPEDFKLQMQDAYDRFGVVNYLITDETFNDYTEKIIRYADVVQELPFKPWFGGYIRADLMISRGRVEQEELLRMNFLGHYYGVESMNTASARSIGKGMQSERMQQGLIDCKDYFMKEGDGLYRGSISLIAGLPHETKESLMKTKDWLLKNWQGQWFGMNLLALHRHELVKPSKLDLNYAKYGYEEMDPSEYDPDAIANETLKKGSGKTDWPDEGLVRWKNEHMNCFEADKIVAEIVKDKLQADFRIHTWRLGSRYKNKSTVRDLLAISPGGRENDYYNGDNSEYIQAKLNWKPLVNNNPG